MGYTNLIWRMAAVVVLLLLVLVRTYRTATLSPQSDEGGRDNSKQADYSAFIWIVTP